MLTLNSILKEIKDVPVTRLEELYQIVHSLTPTTKQKGSARKKILSFAGIFNDMSDKEYANFLTHTKKQEPSFLIVIFNYEAFAVGHRDILSEFLRGNMKVIAHVDEHLKEYGFINLSVITYYEIMNGLFYKDAKKQMTRFEKFVELNKVIPLTLRMAKTAASIQADLRKRD